MEPKPENNKPLSIPIAIVFSGILIAGAVFYTGTIKNVNTNLQPAQVNQGANLLDAMRPISDKDHVRGDKDAKVVIVEYSDPECPFCKQFHSTLKKIMAEYGDSGQVAWVYRHFPLDQLHPKARHEAVAMECANELGGNDKFWQYADRIYEITPANNGLDPAELPKIAEYIGLDVAKFNECLSSTKFDQYVEADVKNAFATGGNGTPWSIVVAKNAEKYPLSGAQPYEAVKQIVESAIKNL
jgi:protein-disulfide isomerase